ncbi:MAG: methyl-accepting chemotaxis protein [Lachnospiraceae bacterium]|nr:methyl-accepting chemotaxis protein [Lachnospiraceae bacterium]
MKSLKAKLTAVILTVVIISSVSTAIIGFVEVFGVTEKIIRTQFEDKLNSSNEIVETYLNHQFGSIGVNKDGVMVSQDGKPVEGKYEYLDEVSEKMGVVATLFVKNGSDYTRILTTVLDEQGKRAVGTKLDSTEKVYQEISSGNTYFGEADILGKKCITRYEPIFDSSKQIIGIYFVGVPIENITSILMEGKASALKTVSTFGFVTLLLVIVVSYFAATSITKPLRKITDVAEEIAEGNFNVELNVKSQDEVGHLAKAFSRTVDSLVDYQGYIDEISNSLMLLSQGDLMVELKRDYVGQFQKIKDNMDAFLQNINSTILQINQASHQVASGSEQVSSGAQALSQGATQQASSIEELAATINEISTQIKNNAENAKLANSSAELAEKEIFSSNDQMKSMVSAMEEINAKSSEISKIIKVIEDIAFQTNILALNAAVEAARAGTAGKGFAVVADEVRNLASKSAEAAQSTTKLIEETLVAVEKGSEIAGNTAKSLEESAKVTREAVDLIDKITEASNEQALSVEQVTQGVEQISSVVQNNAATAEESAAASEELWSQSNILKELVARFKLKDDDFRY